MKKHLALLGILVAACGHPSVGPQPQRDRTRPDTLAIVALAKDLASDARRGRGPWSPEAEAAAVLLAKTLERLGAKPVFGTSLLVPFVVASHPADTVHNVVGVIPGRDRRIDGELIGITAHLDHLGVRRPDARGDSIYNGFTDDAIGVAMATDVARRYAASPGDRPLVIFFFNLEEQGLLGSMALVNRPDAAPMLARLKLLIGIDAGTPPAEALEWQLMGASPPHKGGLLADSLARARGWTTTTAVPRPISDVYPFSQHGVPIVFPIPGRTWKGYTDEQRTKYMTDFDRYHQPGDEWRPNFPLLGTWHFADWMWAIVREATQRGRVM